MTTFYHKTLSRLAGSLTCQLLASPLRYPDNVRLLDDDDQDIIAVAQQHRFSQVPLQVTPDSPISHMAMVDWRDPKQIQKTPIPLASIISAQTSISRVVTRLRTEKYLLILHQDVLAQIVTPSDLNKQPMRFYLVTLLAHLESLLADAIFERFGDNENEWLNKLGEGQGQAVRVQHSRLLLRDMDIRAIEAATFADKLRVVHKSPTLLSRIWDGSVRDFDPVYRLVVGFHHRVAEGIPLFTRDCDDPPAESDVAAICRMDLEMLDEALAYIETWIDDLAIAPAQVTITRRAQVEAEEEA